MGMLMHHTWLEEQAKKKVSKPVAKPVEKESVKAEEPIEKRTAGRRKSSK